MVVRVLGCWDCCGIVVGIWLGLWDCGHFCIIPGLENFFRCNLWMGREGVDGWKAWYMGSA